MNTRQFYKRYAILAIPLILQGFATSLVSMVDNIMVGQLGDTAIAAVAMGAKILGILMFTLFAVNASASVFIAQYYGAGNGPKQQEAFRISILFSLGLFLFACFVFFPLHGPIIRFFVKDEGIQAETYIYMKWMLLGFLPFIMTICYSSALKVLGQVFWPIAASLMGMAVNVVFNYILIFGHFGFPALGVQGAALATVLARLFEFIIVYIHAAGKSYDFFSPFWDFLQVTPAFLKRILAKALPLVFNEAIWAFAMATILKLYGLRGGEVIAAIAITDSTSSLFYSVFNGMSVGASVFVSQPLGAGRREEAFANGKTMIKLSLLVSLFLGLCLWGASFIVPGFYQVSAASFQLATLMIRVVGSLFWIFVVTAQCYFIIRAGGDMKSTLILDGLFMWGVTIPVIAFLAYFTAIPIFPMYVLGQFCDLVKMLVGLGFFFRKKWMHNLTLEGEG